MFEFLTTDNFQFGISIALLVWSAVWALLAMWKSAKKGHGIWFVVLFLSLIGWYLYPNTLTTVVGFFGALPILYFFVLSRFSFKDNNLVFESWKFKKK
ncbi:MAG: DUF5652 family protein [Nanoarchaeota archaeon]|nr:DUF5652 family protein [Nanoarchaeota archaeon]